MLQRGRRQLRFFHRQSLAEGVAEGPVSDQRLTQEKRRREREQLSVLTRVLVRKGDNLALFCVGLPALFWHRPGHPSHDCSVGPSRVPDLSRASVAPLFSCRHGKPCISSCRDHTVMPASAHRCVGGAVPAL